MWFIDFIVSTCGKRTMTSCLASRFPYTCFELYLPLLTNNPKRRLDPIPRRHTMYKASRLGIGHGSVTFIQSSAFIQACVDALFARIPRHIIQFMLLTANSHDYQVTNSVPLVIRVIPTLLT